MTDWIPLFAAVLTALTAAAAALMLHRQRLAHEREMNEIDALRLLLYEGALLLEDGFEIYGDLSRRAVAREGEETLVEFQHAVAENAADYTRRSKRYQARLQLWFGADEPVVQLWQEAHWAVGSALSVFRDGLAPSTHPADPEYGIIESEAAEAAFAWKAAARKAMRPHLERDVADDEGVPARTQRQRGWVSR